MNAALESIWHDFAGRLRRYIRARVADASTAEDILQDVFVKLHRRLDQLDDPARLQGWIHLVARNAVIDHYRTRKRTVPLPEGLADTLADETQAEGEPVEPEVAELKAAFLRMIHSLPEPYREALIQTEFQGLTQRELAGRLGLSLSAAKSRVQRGRAQLKRMLQQCCTFEFDRRGHVIGCEPRAASDCTECAPPSERGPVRPSRRNEAD